MTALDRTEVTPRTKAGRTARKRRAPGDWAAIDAAINARSGGSCDIEHPGCTGRWTERHHRLLRSQGGPDDPELILGLCSAGHRFVHANPALSYEQGWLVHSWEEA